MKFSVREGPPGAGIMQHSMLMIIMKTLSPIMQYSTDAVNGVVLNAWAPVGTAVTVWAGSWVVTNHALLPGRSKVGSTTVRAKPCDCPVNLLVLAHGEL